MKEIDSGRGPIGLRNEAVMYIKSGQKPRLRLRGHTCMTVDDGVMTTWDSAADSCFEGGDKSNSAVNEFILGILQLSPGDG